MKLNTDKINSLLNQIEQADVIVCDDSPYLHSVDVWSLVTGEPDNEILYINWHDEEFEYVTKITEQGLNDANFIDNQITLLDHEGDHTVIKLYSLEANPVIKNWE